MSELAPPLRRALERTGYLTGAKPAAASVRLAGSPDLVRPPSFAPDAWWRSNPDATAQHGSADLKVYFKFVDEPDAAPTAEWQQEVWNQGFCPLLWLVSPQRIDLYNGFGYPRRSGDADQNRLATFRFVDEELARLDRLAGRLAMETGQFWRQIPKVNRASAVDRQLLRELAALKSGLEDSGLAAAEAQALIGRAIFTQYLIDRKIVDPERLEQISKYAEFPDVLQDRAATERLFDWLRDTFNGDMFPTGAVPAAEHLGRVRDFLTATDPETGQLSLFPYRFDVIPVELISAIYEQFVHSTGAAAWRADVHYTPLTAVSLVLDEVFAGLTGTERVLDLTCGSGVFLVESLRRLVHLQSNGREPTQGVIRRTLHEQIYGVDQSLAAVNIAAFSLYLAALELDRSPSIADGVRFEPLVDRTLRVSDAFDVDWDSLKFDVIVGNPPWSYPGEAANAARRRRAAGAPQSPRGRSLDFVRRALDFAHDRTRLGMIVSATPFFSRSATGLAAAQSLVDSLGPVTLVNLSDLATWLFPRADMPAMALLARCHDRKPDRMTLVQARWSPTGESSNTIEIAPSDVTTLPLASWQRNPALFKAAFLGSRLDLLLLDELRDKTQPLAKRLAALGTGMRTGLKFGSRSRNASFLCGIPFAQRGDIAHFSVPAELRAFDCSTAEGPRTLAVYRAPLVLVKEFMLKGHPRAVVAVTERDTVFSDAYFGASFADGKPEVAHLLAGVLGSALASWYFLMTGSSFGVWMRRVMPADVRALPIPDLEESARTEAGKRVVRLVRTFHDRARNHDWQSLDDAVFDLYGLDEEDRIVVQDGLAKADWQWTKGRQESVEPADEADLQAYARAFLFSMDAWLSAGKRRHMRAEIYRLPVDAPIRVIRFVLEEGPGPSTEAKVIAPEGELSDLLARIGDRSKVQLAKEMVGLRDLRVHAADEVSIIKPAARRNWLRVYALDDADQTVQDSVGVNAE